MSAKTLGYTNVWKIKLRKHLKPDTQCGQEVFKFLQKSLLSQEVVKQYIHTQLLFSRIEKLVDIKEKCIKPEQAS